jgi:dTDP-4-dehydrorhamnose reductase
MKAIVTGAGGMLARALVPALETKGWVVVPLAKADADVTRIEDLRRTFAAARPDWVFHLAAFTRVNDCETREEYALRVNGAGAGHAAKAAAEVGAAVMLVSTDYVFDGKSRQPYREDDATAPLNAYGRSKLAGEQATRAENPRHLIVRTAWLYGRGGRNFPDTILGQAREGKALRVVNDQIGSPTWTEDLAPALARLAANGASGTLHCTSSGECSWYGFAKYLIEKEGLDVPVEAIRSADLPPPIRPAYSALSNERYEKATGHRMPDWEDSVDGYLESLRAADRATGERT